MPTMQVQCKPIAAWVAIVALISFSATPAHALTNEEIFNYHGADRQTMLVDGAKKESEVVLYSAMIVNQMLRPLTAGFMKKYPFIKMSYYRADSEQLVPKISAEARAGSAVADLFEGSGGGALAVEAGLTLPFYSPELAAFPKTYLDPKRQLAPTRLSYFSIAYNTKLVPPDKVPKTYEALLDPQWTGKMAWPYAYTGRYLFLINLLHAWGDDKAMAYFKKLAQQKIINFASGSARTLVNRVISGEYPIAINIYAHHPLISAAKGAPVNSQLMNPVPSAAGTVAAIKESKHPHAAMLLMDFMLSKQGQEILSKAHYFPVRSDVEAAPELAKIIPKKAGYTENFVTPYQLKDEIAGADKILQELFR